jgi:hypothetical protein
MDNLLTMCCVCKKIKVNDNWVDEKYSDYHSIVEKAGNEISDDYCPKCLKNVIEESKRIRLLFA